MDLRARPRARPANRHADVVGNRLAALDEALERLFLYVAEGDAEVHVRLEHVEQCIARTRVHSVFDLTDALGRRDAAAATRVLEAMAANREPPIKTLGAIAFHFRRLWKLLDGMQSGGTADEVGRALNINGYFLRDFVRQSRMFTHRELAWLLNRLYETDKLLKSSRAAPEHHMQSLVLDICVR